jgi:hypothetical protein
MTVMEAQEAPAVRWRGLLAPGPAVAAVFFVLLLARNASRLRHPIREAADFAANSMLIDRAEQGRQLTGNYSRVHFHHPGPVFLYVGALGQALFHQLLHVVPADFNGQLISFFALNAVLAGLVVTELRRQVRSTAACVTAVAVVLVWLSPHIAIAVPWPPYLYALPFLLLAVTAPAVVVGELRSLPAYTLAGAILVHGHVSFLMFVGVTTVAVLVCWLVVNRARRRELLAGARRQLVVSGVIVFVFLLPMVLDLVLHWPGQWPLYWHYSRQAKTNPISGVLRFTGHFWTTVAIGWLGFAAALVVSVLLVLRVPAPQRRYLVWLAATVVFLVGLVMFYAYRGVDDLTEIYTGDFSTVLPGLVLGVAAGLVVQALSQPIAKALPLLAVRALAAVLGVGAGLVVLSGSGMAATLAVYPDVESDLAQLQAMAAPGQAIVLGIPHVGATWPKALAVLEEAHRRGIPVCVADPAWRFIVAPAVECSPHEVATGLKVESRYVGPTVKKLTTVTWSGGRLEYTLG